MSTFMHNSSTLIQETSVNRGRRHLLALGAAVAASPFGVAAAADFPSKTIRIVVPFSAGALTDIIARIYAEKLSPMLGQPVIVENRPGAGGITASQAILSQPADGHTLLFVSSADSVVDSQLRVHGIKSLRVADASIMPTIASSNTNAPAMMIGERVAEMLLTDARRGNERAKRYTI
ncbi:tripartite tricarboxylate transporter substrate-binding protein [Ottowia sp.]|uniref:Bug family tripartite tricarboxylate transporter substrate binding protein n=1 Tax=Ottowia sp. TaxID=1898956 RepID=UPI0025CE7958|nr:tripartite tricarboxylate transporter substrate-binding protein [Ottowia sp.]MBK6613722.1 hypothetical protein [Ottowia sp.]MBK6616785.1 hypothetical protein [Ottowia sp.]